MDECPMRWKVNGVRLVRETQEGVGKNEGARKREDDRRKDGMKEVGQRRKSGVKSLSANKPWP